GSSASGRSGCRLWCAACWRRCDALQSLRGSVGWAKALALTPCTAMPLVRRAHAFLRDPAVLLSRGHGARWIYRMESLCSRLCPPYILRLPARRERPRKRDEAFDRDVLGALRRRDGGGAEQFKGITSKRFEALAQHLAA